MLPHIVETHAIHENVHHSAMQKSGRNQPPPLPAEQDLRPPFGTQQNQSARVESDDRIVVALVGADDRCGNPEARIDQQKQQRHRRMIGNHRFQCLRWSHVAGSSPDLLAAIRTDFVVS